MPLATLTPDLLTGNPIIDKQHKTLIDMVNELHDAVVAGKAKEILGPTLEKLAKYTVEHFRTEEGLMTQAAYPGLEQHRSKHRELEAEAKKVIDGYKSGKLVLSLTLSQFLANWVAHHIKDEDKHLVEFLRQHPRH